MGMQEYEIKGKTTVTAELKTQIDDSSNSALFKEFGDVLPELVKNLRTMNMQVSQTGQNLPAIRRTVSDKERLDERLTADRERGLVSVVNTGCDAENTTFFVNFSKITYIAAINTMFIAHMFFLSLYLSYISAVEFCVFCQNCIFHIFHKLILSLPASYT